MEALTVAAEQRASAPLAFGAFVIPKGCAVTFVVWYLIIMLALLVGGFASKNGLLMGCGALMVPLGLILTAATILSLFVPCLSC